MSEAHKPHSELLRYWLSDAHSHADPKFLDRNQVIEDALALARELESTLEQLEAAHEEILFLCSDEDDIRKGLREQYEGALATIETLESKEELSAIIRSQTEEIESLEEQLEALVETLEQIAGPTPTSHRKTVDQLNDAVKWRQGIARDALARLDSNPASRQEDA